MIELLKIKEKRRAKRFDDFAKPAFKELQDVHGDYLAMFQHAKALVLGKTKNAAGNTGGSAAVDYLEEKRIAFAPVRAKLRALSALLREESMKKSLSREELHFIQAVVAYFETSNAKSTPVNMLISALSMEYAGSDLQIVKLRGTLGDVSAGEAVIDQVVAARERVWDRAAKAFHKLQLVVDSHAV